MSTEVTFMDCPAYVDRNGTAQLLAASISSSSPTIAWKRGGRGRFDGGYEVLASHR